MCEKSNTLNVRWRGEVYQLLIGCQIALNLDVSLNESVQLQGGIATGSGLTKSKAATHNSLASRLRGGAKSLKNYGAKFTPES